MSYAHIGDLQTWGLIYFTSWSFEAHDKYDDAYPQPKSKLSVTYKEVNHTHAEKGT